MIVCVCVGEEKERARKREREIVCFPQRKATGEEQLKHNMKTEEERGLNSQELGAPGWFRNLGVVSSSPMLDVEIT